MITQKPHRRGGFTLIEILASIAIVSILAAISFGVLTGVQSKMAISRAQAEIAALSAALERYKAQYGSYPTNPGYDFRSNSRMLAALGGVAYFDGTAIPDDQMPNAYIAFDEFDIRETFESDAPDFSERPDLATLGSLNILDPWGNPYAYFFEEISTETAWRNPTFVLFSFGPDAEDFATNFNPASMPGNLLPGGNGVITPKQIRDSDPDNLDNVFAEL